MKPKRLISLLVAVCMMITMLPLSAVTAFATDTASSTGTASYGDYEYDYTINTEDGTATITYFRGPVDSANHGPYDITIPTELDHHPVTGLGVYSFAYRYVSNSYEWGDLVSQGNSLCSNIRSVTIPQSVTSIGNEAFCYCENLQSLTFQGPIKSMGVGAFEYCTKLEEVNIPNDTTSIGNYAFYKCSALEKVNIPNGITSIGKSVFGECSALKSVTIPQSVTSIGEHAFYKCSALEKVDIPNDITSIGQSVFYECSALKNVTIPQSVTSIGDSAFAHCENLDSLTINDATTSIGSCAFEECYKLTTLSLGKNITTIGDYAFWDCRILDNVTIPDSVTSIGKSAFYQCYALTTLSLGENIEKIGSYAFAECRNLTNVTIPEKVKTIEPYTFGWCLGLKYITLPAGLTSFKDWLVSCPAGFVKQSPQNGAIYYKNYKEAAERLRDNPDDQSESHHILANRKFLYLCDVTFDANGGSLTDSAKVPVYKTEKITDTKANELKAIHDPTRAGYNFTGWYTKDGQLFDVNKTAITENITLYAHWDKAPVYHPLTVTGGTATVEKDGQPLNIVPDVTGDKKTYSVPDGAKVTVKLDKNAAPEDKVFDGWSTGDFSLPTGDYKAESITFTMSSDVDIAAQYRDAATDHTPDTAVCHPLTVTGGIVTVKKGDKDVTDTLTVTTDETTGQKTYSVPDGAEVTVTLDKTLVPEGMVFDIWSTGKFSLPQDQNYKAESITFTMSSDVDIAAQYRDASIEDDGPGVLGTAAIIGTAAVGTAVLGYQAYSLGAEFAGKLMALPYFPSNRSALAMMLWEDAGKPMPESELLYPDVGQEERDMDLQHAARWAMENELIPDLNDEGTAPEEMKFFPANPVSKLDVLNAWQKAQELKNN